jgi:RNA methyltransferase, TrmH family
VDAISSRQNPFVQRCRELARHRQAGAGDILIDGLHLLAEAVAAGVPITAAAAPVAVWASPAGAALLRALDARGTRTFEASESVIEAASPVRTPTGAVALGRRLPAGIDEVFARGPALVVCTVHVQDPGNVGAIVRAAEAAGATGVLAASGSADPLGWKALRGSMGSAFRLPVAAVADPGDACMHAHARGVRVIATSPGDGTDLDGHDLTGPVMVLVGAEGAGLPAPVLALADAALRIPMHPPVESLNVAVAAGVILFEAQRQRRCGTRS